MAFGPIVQPLARVTRPHSGFVHLRKSNWTNQEDVMTLRVCEPLTSENAALVLVDRSDWPDDRGPGHLDQKAQAQRDGARPEPPRR